MFRPTQCILVALVLITSASTASAADVIERRGATAKLSGKITDVSKDKVTIETSKGDKVDVPTNEIEEILWDGEPAALKSARNNESAGRLTQASDGFVKAATDNKSDRPEVKLDIDYLALRTTSRLAMTDPAKVPDVLKKLNEFQSKNSNSRHFYDAVRLQVDLNLTVKDAAAARAAAETLAKSSGNDQKLAAKIAIARVSVLESKIPEAQQAFEEVIASPMGTPAEESRKLEAKLGLASCLQLQSKPDDAVKLLNDVIVQCAKEDSRIKAEAYTRQGDSYQAAGKNKDALLAYLHVDLLFSTEKAYHPEALYQLTRMWTAIQQPDRASETAERLTSEYPNSPWTQKLKAPAPAAEEKN